ncbi:MAG TPA: transcriptional repressor LexA [Xanthomonadaceae bacterium]|nr:transcriptional repressor LexA [Xanthomonadaceae bacterium]
MSDLTARQQAILDFVRERIAADGLPPTWAEIAQAFGFRQTRAAQKHLQALAAKGYLTLLPGKARGIRVAGAKASPVAVPRFADVRPSADHLDLPVLGRVAAGMPIGADIGSERRLLLDRTLFATRPDYLLRVEGDSMRDEGILDGDLVAVRRTPDARDGQVVVARVDGELTIKRLQQREGALRLLPRNPAYPPIDVQPGQDFAIEGVYCGLVRHA